MTKSTIENPITANVAKSKVEKAGHYLTVASTALGICGVLGTVFVWVTANFLLSDVEVKTDKPVESLIVKVYDRKGEESIFHTPSFQVLPGKYHLDVLPQGAKTVHCDLTVKFGRKAEVPISVVSGMEEQLEPESGKRHWWQFWKS